MSENSVQASKNVTNRCLVAAIILLVAALAFYIYFEDLSDFLTRTAANEIAGSSADLLVGFAAVACIYFAFRAVNVASPLVNRKRYENFAERVDQMTLELREVATEGLVFSLVFAVILAWFLGGVYIAPLSAAGAVLVYRLLSYRRRVEDRDDDGEAYPDLPVANGNARKTVDMVEAALIKKYQKWLTVVGLTSFSAIVVMVWSLYGVSRDAAVAAAKAAADESEQAMQTRFTESAGIISELHNETVRSMTTQLDALGEVKGQLKSVSTILPVLVSIDPENAKKNAELLSANQDRLNQLVNVEDLHPKVTELSGFAEDYEERIGILEGSSFVLSSELNNYATKAELPDHSEFAVGDHPDVTRFITRDDLPDTSGFAQKTELSRLASLDNIPDVSGFASTSDVQFTQLGSAYRQYEPTGAFASGTGLRSDRIRIEFDVPFAESPNVGVSLSEIEASNSSAVRIRIVANNVTRSGFDCDATVTDDTRVYKVGCSWLAVGLRSAN